MRTLTLILFLALSFVSGSAYILMSASDAFKDPTHRVHEMWQTDFTYFRIINWGGYYLSTVLDDFSRYIIAWKLSPTMGATDVTETLDEAIAITGVDQAKVKQRPRLLSDNGPAYLSGANLTGANLVGGLLVGWELVQRDPVRRPTSPVQTEFVPHVLWVRHRNHVRLQHGLHR